MKIERVLISIKPNIDHKKISDVIKVLHSNFISVFSLEKVSEPDVQLFEGQKVDIVFVLGGDGAILRTVEKIVNLPQIPPIVGVNMGKVGFLTFGESRIEKIIDKIKKDEYVVDKKRLMCVSGKFALNDIVMKCPDLCHFEIQIDDYEKLEIRADGIIVSSQTGSTAYNLSVGGPLAIPGLDLFIISFIAPFSLSARPVIVGPNRKIKIKSKDQCNIYADGKPISEEKEIEVRYSEKTLEILREHSFSFFDTLRKKLEW